MKKIVFICLSIYFSLTAFAQSPQKISYQAVIRNSDQALVANKQVTMRVYILQGSITGTPVYIETHSPTTNVNGLISIEIGGGAVVSGSFSSIDWANGPYFVQTYSDPNGGTSYSLTVTSQLLSVPYAIHARTAEKIIGGINEKDPVFESSISKGITSSDTSRWNKKQSKLIAGKNVTITNDTIKSSFTESDPVFDGSIAKGITLSDTSRWNKKQSKLIAGTNVTITNDTIKSSITEIDPVFDGSIAKGIKATDTSKWNNKQNKLVSGDNIKLSGDTISVTGISKRFIGEYYGGGVIFHLWKDAQGIEHGLVVSLNVQSNAHIWSNVSNSIIGITAQSNWDGLSNCNAIVGQSGHLNSAAKLCLDLVSGGQNDWYLPSYDEQRLLWQNRFEVNRTLSVISGASQISTAYHWSSTESSPTHAWGFFFSNGSAFNFGDDGKAGTNLVRAVRSF